MAYGYTRLGSFASSRLPANFIYNTSSAFIMCAYSRFSQKGVHAAVFAREPYGRHITFEARSPEQESNLRYGSNRRERAYGTFRVRKDARCAVIQWSEYLHGAFF